MAIKTFEELQRGAPSPWARDLVETAYHWRAQPDPVKRRKSGVIEITTETAPPGDAIPGQPGTAGTPGSPGSSVTIGDVIGAISLPRNEVAIGDGEGKPLKSHKYVSVRDDWGLTLERDLFLGFDDEYKQANIRGPQSGFQVMLQSTPYMTFGQGGIGESFQGFNSDYGVAIWYNTVFGEEGDGAASITVWGGIYGKDLDPEKPVFARTSDKRLYSRRLEEKDTPWTLGKGATGGWGTFQWDPVAITGESFQVPAISVAAAAISTRSWMIGVSAEGAGLDQDSNVFRRGPVDLDTSTYTGSVGSQIWLQPTGGLNTTKPAASNSTRNVMAGYLLVKAAETESGTGKIYIDPINFPFLHELSGVSAASPTDKQILSFSSASNRWESRLLTSADISGGPFLPLAAGAGSPLTGELYASQGVRVGANMLLRDLVGVAGFGAVYGTTNPPDSGNYLLAFQADGSEAYFNATSKIGLDIAGIDMLLVTSTGTQIASGKIYGSTAGEGPLIDVSTSSSSLGSVAIRAAATNGVAVYGGASAAGGVGVLGTASGSGSSGVSATGAAGADGLFAQATGGGKAGRFSGDVSISGTTTFATSLSGIARLASGVLSASALASGDIPSLDASKVTTGTFADARIASAATWNAKLSTVTADATSRAANTFYAAPNGAAGTATFRAIVAADIPTLNQSTTGSAAKWTMGRTLTIGATGKAVDGSANVSWTLAEIGALASGGTAVNSSALGGVGSAYFVQGNGAGPYGHRTTNVSSFNTLLPSGFYDNNNGISPLTTGWTHMIRSAHSDPSSGSATWSFDIAANFYTTSSGDEGYYVRVNEGSNWGTWRKLWHSGNLTPAAIGAATTAHAATHHAGGSDQISGQSLSGLRAADSPAFAGLKLGSAGGASPSANTPLVVRNASSYSVIRIESGTTDVAVSQWANASASWSLGVRSDGLSGSPVGALVAADATSARAWWTSAGMTVPGQLAAGSAILKTYADPNYYSLWGDGASAPNYTLAASRSGAEAYLNGSSKVSLCVGANERVVASISGVKLPLHAGTGTRMVTAAADGTLGATSWADDGPWLSLANGGTVSGATAFSGGLSSGVAAMGTSSVSVSYAWFGYRSRATPTAGAEGFFHTNSGQIYVGAPAGKCVDFLVGGTTVASAVSTGFGVAGDLTASIEVRAPIIRTNGSLVFTGVGTAGAGSAPSGYSRVVLPDLGTTVLPTPSAGAFLIVQRTGTAPSAFYIKPAAGHTISYMDLGGIARIMKNSATSGLNVGAVGGSILLVGVSSTAWAVIGAWPQGS